ncbi:Acetoin utilization deacetylase AcuC [Marinitoga hydrogenitolerans DSM 16785]|uniref:Acetoin utilization deacetylase AcuC n=1 Tax=Marinitoga hydrogenitolerans (strain DSM 16785 / JCM 12826 / AT1271) TaxID=1122195 RepID=A0A1M4Z602_MARH1|nr:histone deacetylase family protein [Marinitoga hydrogenitolerans]SHF13454.1 Acetoin utilization deacetylase AcuC [Marinitoga hydrogenitolerans DSM 16785]
MRVVYDPRHVFYSPKNELNGFNMVENRDKPGRIERIKEIIQLKYGNIIVSSKDFPRSYLYFVHSSDYVSWLKEKQYTLENNQEYFPRVFGYDMCMDTKTPISKNTFEMAWISAKCALTGASLLLEGEDLIYSCSRPPGHHAGINYCGGGSYFNNAALATRYLQKTGDIYVAVLDLDFYAGNGTQDVFYNDNTVLTVSIHGNPSNHYPYISGFEWEIGENEGKGYNVNFALKDDINGRIYLRVLEKALLEIEDFDPDFLIISFGSNTHKDDLTTTFNLEDEDYKDMGEMISYLNIPKLIIQESGFNSQSTEKIIANLFDGLII